MKMLNLIQLFSLTLNLCMIECKRKTSRDTVSSSDCYPCTIPKKKKPALVCKEVCVTKKRPRRCEPPNRPRRPHLPMCPPSSPPCPPDTTCRQVLTTLNQLLSDKLLDLEYLFASKTQLLQDGIRDAVLGHGRRFAKDAKDSNTALVNTLLGLLSASSTAVSSEVTQIVTRANTSLLNGFNSLVNTANANTSTLVTALAGQTAAQIDTIVKDLRGTNGLLSQLLRITGTLSAGMTDLFETVGPTELAAITQAIGTLSPLAEQVRDAVNTSNQALLKIHSRYIVHLTKKLAEFVHWYANDLLLAVETLFADYAFEVNRIVSSVLSCNENDLAPRYQRPGQLLRGGHQPLALNNNPRYGGRLAQLLPDGLPGDDSLLFGGSPSALPTSTG